jgi:hypothetical protein
MRSTQHWSGLVSAGADSLTDSVRLPHSGGVADLQEDDQQDDDDE